MNPDLVEAVARAMFADTNDNQPAYSWEQGDEATREIYVSNAKAALKAHGEWLASQGLVVVPRDPDSDMGQAGYAAWDSFGEEAVMGPHELIAIWRGMVNAKQPPETPHSPAESEIGSGARHLP